MATRTLRFLLTHPTTPLVAALVTLVMAVTGFEYLDTHPSPDPWTGMFVFQALVMLGCILVFERLRRIKYGEAIRAAGGWGANQTGVMLALLPIVLALAAAAYGGMMSFDDAVGTGAHRSAHWFAKQGHYYVQYDQDAAQEITRQEYEDVGRRMTRLFSRIWIFLGIVLVGLTISARLWPGVGLLNAGAALSAARTGRQRAPVSWNPVRRLLRSEPVRIPVRGVGSAAIEQLRKATPRTAWSTLFKGGVVGKVSESDIRLMRYRPMFHNGLAPVLMAHLENNLQGAAIVGVFRMSTYTRLFMGAWFVMLILFTALSLLSIPAGSGEPSFAMFGLGMLAAGYAILLFGQMEWAEECEFIEAHVRKIVAAN